ncbi:hypothetical protein SAMN05414137_116223 [Streptacidiphilus jiangxiensis]|uniref:Gram-positive cocci surface proteins LPxTG domain-containing protein n=2 Tax=Streptacidiphilus jiangxiensis TaxID=235985 RepID=A0A1H7UXK5_STRJI|nr:hypothetical protein SAMN05414137_116223 [Streptacidiphilus jiangxiensis]
MVAGLVLASVTTMMAAAGPAAAASGGDYGLWALGGGGGSVAFPVRGFPQASFTTTSTSPSTPSGSSTYLNDSTPFGAEFGSSRNHDYLLVRTARGGAPSATTVTFDSPAPAGRWGFALGDIDADRVRIEAVDENGVAVSGSEFGWQGAFNYCASSPRPGSCTRGPFTDEPVWHAGSHTLTGHVVDTDGAAGWFRPTVPIRSITFEFSVQSGIPVGQIWMAALPGPETTPSPSPSTPTVIRLPAERVELPSGASSVPIPISLVEGLPATHVVVEKQPEHGTVHLHGSELVYHPEPGCPRGGVDRLTYRAHNRKGQTATRRVRIAYQACEPPTLAPTGADPHTLLPLALGAAGLLGVGGALLVVARRRKDAGHADSE